MYLTRIFGDMESIGLATNNNSLLIGQIIAISAFVLSYVYFNIELDLPEDKIVTITQMSCNFIILVSALATRKISNDYVAKTSKEDRRKLELSLTYESLELYPLSDIEKSCEPSILKGDL